LRVFFFRFFFHRDVTRPFGSGFCLPPPVPRMILVAFNCRRPLLFFFPKTFAFCRGPSNLSPRLCSIHRLSRPFSVHGLLFLLGTLRPTLPTPRSNPVFLTFLAGPRLLVLCFTIPRCPSPMGGPVEIIYRVCTPVCRGFFCLRGMTFCVVFFPGRAGSYPHKLCFLFVFL